MFKGGLPVVCRPKKTVARVRVTAYILRAQTAQIGNQPTGVDGVIIPVTVSLMQETHVIASQCPYNRLFGPRLIRKVLAPLLADIFEHGHRAAQHIQFRHVGTGQLFRIGIHMNHPLRQNRRPVPAACGGLIQINTHDQYCVSLFC